MKLLINLFLFLLLSSCGLPQGPGPVFKTPPQNPDIGIEPHNPEPHEEPTSPLVTVEEEIESYVNAFEVRNLLAGGGFNPSNLTVVLEDLDPQTLGTCSMNTATVTLNTYFWKQLPASSKEELIFHELGHCVLGRKHDDSLTTGGRAVSIMHSQHLGSTYYLPYYIDYMAELFHTSPSTFSGLIFNEQDYPRPQEYNFEVSSIALSQSKSKVIKCNNH